VVTTFAIANPKRLVFLLKSRSENSKKRHQKFGKVRRIGISISLLDLSIVGILLSTLAYFLATVKAYNVMKIKYELKKCQ